MASLPRPSPCTLFAKAEGEDARLREDTFYPELREAPWPIVYHEFMSAFENNADYLRRLHVLRTACPDRTTVFCYFVFACDVDDVSEVAERNWREGPSFDDLLVWVLALFGEFGSAYWGFSTRPDVAFGKDSRIRPALEALASLGYLSRSEAGYLWTERLARTMERAGMWQNGKPRSAHRV